MAGLAEALAQARDWLHGLDSALQKGVSLQELQDGLDQCSGRVEQQVRQGQQALRSEPTLEELRAQEVALQGLSAELASWTRSLAERSGILQEQAGQLAELLGIWKATAGAARQEGASPILVDTIDQVLASLEGARGRLEGEQARLLALQNRFEEQEASLAAARSALVQARESLVGQVLDQDSPALWNLGLKDSWHDLGLGMDRSLRTQLTDLEAYIRHRIPRLGLSVVLFGVFFLAVRWASRRMQPHLRQEQGLQQMARVLEAPVAVSLLLTVALGRLAGAQAPRLFLGILGAIVLVPAVFVLRQLLDRYLLPLMNALVLFYLVDLCRAVAAPVPTVARLLLLAETLLAMAFLLWYQRPARFLPLSQGSRDVVYPRVLLVVRVALGLFAASALANLFGYAALATLLGAATLRSAYAALVLLALARVLQSGAVLLLHLRPLSLSRAVRRNRALVAARCSRLLHWLALGLWVLVALEVFSVRTQVLGALGGVLHSAVPLGTFRLSLADVLVFVLAVWVATLVSRFVRFVLDEDVYPRLQLHRGTSTALSTTLHYAVLVLGFLFAMAAAGLDMTKFTVLLSALSVGIGFGLQNIVSNFVSGLILLFDRSLAIGDPIQFAGNQGELARIGLRASTIRLLDGRELIVPNSHLMDQQVINGTAATLQPRRIEIGFALVGPVDGRPVLDLLRSLAGAHPQVVATPEPQALFTGFQDGVPGFLLQVWTLDIARVPEIRSELSLSLGEALHAGGYRVAGPLREVRLSTPDAAAPGD